MGQLRVHRFLSRTRFNTLSFVPLLHHRHQRYPHLRQRHVLSGPTGHAWRLSIRPTSAAHRAFGYRRRVEPSLATLFAPIHRVPAKAQGLPSRRCPERARSRFTTRSCTRPRTYTAPPQHRHRHASISSDTHSPIAPSDTAKFSPHPRTPTKITSYRTPWISHHPYTQSTLSSPRSAKSEHGSRKTKTNGHHLPQHPSVDRHRNS